MGRRKTKKLYLNNVNDEHTLSCCVGCPFKDLHIKVTETETTVQVTKECMFFEKCAYAVSQSKLY